MLGDHDHGLSDPENTLVGGLAGTRLFGPVNPWARHHRPHLHRRVAADAREGQMLSPAVTCKLSAEIVPKLQARQLLSARPWTIGRRCFRRAVRGNVTSTGLGARQGRIPSFSAGSRHARNLWDSVLAKEYSEVLRMGITYYLYARRMLRHKAARRLDSGHWNLEVLWSRSGVWARLPF